MDTRKKLIKRQVKNNATDIDAMGEDLVTEILSKLPVKYLLRSRSVSKTWYALTNTDYFIRKHVVYHSSEYDNNHRQCPILRTLAHDHVCELSLLRREKEQTVSLRLPFIPTENRRQLVGVSFHGSSHGLVFLTSMVSVNEDEDGATLVQRSIVVWNPATEQYRILPKPNTNNTKIPFSKNQVNDIARVRGRGPRSPLVGFDFIHQHKDIFEYRVARVFGRVDKSGDKKKYIYRAQMFVQNTNSWREVKHEIALEYVSRIRTFSSTSVTIDSVLYWKIQREVGEDKWCSIMSFDLRAEVFNEMQIPIHLNDQDSDWRNLILFSWKSSLATTALHYFPDYDDYYLILWSMSIDKNNNNNPVWSFTKLEIDHLSFQKGLIHVMGCWKDRVIIGSTCSDGVAEDDVDYLYSQRVLFSYDPETETMTRILKDGEKIKTGYGILDYVESLTPV